MDSPKLFPIDKEYILFGGIHLYWSAVPGATSYNIYRDYEKITNIQGWHSYASVNGETVTYDDQSFQNKSVYYYVVVAVKGTELSPISNCERVQVKIPEHLMIESQQVKEAAYFSSIKSSKIDEKIWNLARLQLIIENSFPTRTIDYLMIKVKSLKKDLPEFGGLLNVPTEEQIRLRAEEIYRKNVEHMELDWQISEREYLLKKIEELIEFEFKAR